MAMLHSLGLKLCKQLPREIVSGNSTRLYCDVALIRIDRCPGREQIGYGQDGDKDYFDRRDMPCPAVRYKRETPELKVIVLVHAQSIPTLTNTESET